MILGLVLLLLVYSILAFLNNWKKNYRDISTCVQYSHLAQQHNNSKYFLHFIYLRNFRITLNVEASTDCLCSSVAGPYIRVHNKICWCPLSPQVFCRRWPGTRPSRSAGPRAECPGLCGWVQSRIMGTGVKFDNAGQDGFVTEGVMVEHLRHHLSFVHYTAKISSGERFKIRGRKLQVWRVMSAS